MSRWYPDGLAVAGVEDGAGVLDRRDAAAHVANLISCPIGVLVSEVSPGAQGSGGVAAAESEGERQGRCRAAEEDPDQDQQDER